MGTGTEQHFGIDCAKITRAELCGGLAAPGFQHRIILQDLTLNRNELQHRHQSLEAISKTYWSVAGPAF